MAKGIKFICREKHEVLNRIFYVDIVEDDETYEAWLYEKDYSIKMLMFGVMKDNKKLIKGFSDSIKINIINYAMIYISEYED